MSKDNASSQASGSKNSLQSSQAGSQMSRNGAAALLHRATFFPIIAQLELHVDRKFTALGMLVELFQLIGLVFNGNFVWSSIFGTHIARVVYFFNMPLFDPWWATNAYFAAHIFFWLVAATTIAAMITFLWYLRSDHRQLPPLVQTFIAHHVHAFSSFLLIPSILILTSFMVCDMNYTNLYWYSSQNVACTSILGNVYFAAGVISLLCLFIENFASTVLLFDDNFVSNNVMARAHSSVSATHILVKFGLAITFNVLLSKGLGSVFAPMMAAVLIAHSFQVVCLLPFFRMRVNRWRFASLWAATVFATMAAIPSSDQSSWIIDSTNTVITVVLSSSLFVIAWIGTTFRLESKYVSAARNLQRGNLNRDRDPLFPNNLPRNDLVFLGVQNVEQAVIQQGGEETEDADGETASILVAYISSVIFPSDVELATRFINEHQVNSGNPPTDRMKAFAARIFTKGMCKFRRNPLVSLHYCHFLLTVCRKHRMALQELDALAKLDCSFAISYRSSRLQSKIKAYLNMQDTTHIKLLNTSLRLHKEILGHMVTFWSKLLSQNVDTVQLSAVANTITTRREQAVEQFNRVLLNPSQTVLLKYAKFLEQVMLDVTTSKFIQDKVAEHAEMKRLEVIGGAGGGGSQSKLDQSIFGQGGDLMDKLAETDTNADQSQTGGNDTIARLSISIHVLFFLLAIVGGGFFVYEAIRSASVTSSVNKVWAAGRARTLVSLGSMYAGEIQYELSLGNTSTTPASYSNASLTRIYNLQSAMNAVANELYQQHSALTQGNLLSTFSPIQDYLHSTRTEIYTPVSSGLSLSGSMSRSVTDMWNLGYQISAQLTSIATANISKIPVSALQFMTLNGADNFVFAFNKTLDYYEQECTYNLSTSFWVDTGLFAAGIVLCFITYSTMVLNFKKIGAAKLSTLSLFTLIPRLYLEQLHAASKTRVEQFETELSEKEDHEIGNPNAKGHMGFQQPQQQLHSEQAPPPLQQKRSGRSIKSGSSPTAPEGLAQFDSITKLDDGAENEQADEDADDFGDENDREKSSAGQNKSEGITIQMILKAFVLLFSLAIVLVLSVAAFTLVYEAQAASSQAMILHQKDIVRQERIAGLFRIYRDLSDLSRLFTQDGTLYFLEQYYDLWINGNPRRLYKGLQLDETSADNVALFVQMATIVDSLITRQHAAIMLASKSFSLSASQHYLIERIASSHTNYNYTKLQPLINSLFASNGISPSPYPASDNVRDQTLAPSAQLLIARSLLFDDVYNAHFTMLESLRQQLADTLSQSVSDLHATIKSLYSASIAVYGLCFIVFAALARLYTYQKSDSLVQQLALRVGIVVVVANIVVLSIFFASTQSVNTAYSWRKEAVFAANGSYTSMRAQLGQAQGFAQFGQKSFYHTYLDLLDQGTWESNLNQLLRSYLQGQVDSVDETIANVINLRKQGEVLFELAESSMLQSAWGQGYSSARNGELDFLNTTIYNRAREETFEEDIIRFGSSDTIYTNLSYDAGALKLPQMARATLAGNRFLNKSTSVLKSYNDFVNGAKIALGKQIRKVSTYAAQLGAAALALSVVILLLMSLCGMYAAFSVIADNADSSSTVGSTSSSPDTQALFHALTVRARFSLAFIAAILCVIYGVDIWINTSTAPVLHNVNLASSREWTIVNSMLAAQQVWYNSPRPAEMSPFQSRLLEAFNQIQFNRETFYLGDDSSKFNAIGQYSAQDSFLFGSSSYQLLQFQYDCASFLAGPLTSLYTFQDLNMLDNVSADVMSGVFSDGVESVTVQWMVGLLSMSKLSTALSAMTQYRAIFNNVVRPLADNLLSSSSSYRDFYNSLLSTRSTGHFAVAAVLLAAVIGLLFFVFRPIISLLHNEERGTKLLLRMIPNNVRKDVPAISEYLDTGAITQREKMQRINDVCQEMSVVSLLVIDWSGTITKVSRAAQEEFGYDTDELLGKNIKVLMPEDFARNHDQYLMNYRTTGIAKVVDRTRRVVGLRKDGTTFPIEILVREFKRSATESAFLGFARNIQTQIEYEKATKLNEAVSDMCHIPVLVIDPKGTVKRVNSAGLRTFGYSSSELIGKNIKMIMPARISMAHDRYLDTYQRTRRKNVVDSSRKASGLRKNGEEFPVEITVKEMLNEQNETLFFVGYVRDITNELLFMQSVMANEAVIQISPTPVISINPQGVVLIFSPAAEAAWGYKAEDVVGKNIKMLMPEEDAVKHDGYLARYIKTREKHIIDSARTVRARRADGTFFSCEANIKELKKGDHVSYIGYLRDLSREYQIAHQSKVHKMVFIASPVPIIIIDDYGVILQFNAAAEKQLGYRSEQVVNQNIKMLMPDAIADQHDGYLTRYRETGIKTIVDSKRRTHAKKANGRQMSVEIMVKEVIVEDLLSDTGSKRLFIGYLRDITEEHQMLKANQLNDAISNLGTVPMISINRFGAILTFSLAAERTFETTFDEVRGKNVKILMPDAMAAQHDYFLKRYTDTGVKTVIDKVRYITARSMSGREFPVEIRVKEIVKSGLDTVFVGYLRDVTDEIAVHDTKLLVDTIINVSPVPIIVINTKGSVIKFSSEASHVFGWKEEEILNKNVKMLMPSEIARNHDNYLKTYVKTGVKTIIDGVRTVQALRKDGLQLTVEVMVREVRKDQAVGALNVPHDALFVGYVRDMSQEYILRQSNELKDVILNESSIPMVQIDPIGTILFVNPAMSAEFQYSREEVLGRNVKMLMPQSIAKNHDGYLQRYATTRIKHVVDTTREITALRKDGSTFPIQISVREIDADGKTSFFGYIRNMSQQLAIRNSKSLGDMIIDLSMIPLVIINEKGIIESFNRAACETFRYTKEEAIGKNVKLLQPPEVAALHDDYLSNYKKFRVKSVIDVMRRVTGRKKNGTTFPLEISVKELRDPATQVSTYVGYLRDVTDQFRIRIANELAQAVSVLSPIPLIAITATGVIVKWSRAAEEEFGFSAEEIIGQKINLIQPQEVASIHDSFLERYIKTGIKTVVDTTRTVTAKRKNGTTFPAEITVRELVSSDSDRIFIGFLRNLTQDLANAMEAKANRIVSNLMPAPLIVIDDHGMIEQTNSALESLLGYSPQDVVGKNVKMIMLPEVAAQHDAILAKYLQTGVKSVINSKRAVQAVHKDGTVIPVEISVREQFSKELNRLTFLGFLRDLRMELQLKYNFALTDSITDITTVPIIAIDAKGTIFKFSAAASRIFGFSSDDVIGKNIKMLMPEPYASNHDVYLSNYASTGKKTVIDSERKLVAKRKNGTTFHATLRVSEVSKPGFPPVFVGFLNDDTEELEALENAKLSEVINTLADLAVIIIDPRGIITKANETALHLFGYHPSEVIGQNVKMLMPKEIAAAHDGYLDAYGRTGVKHIINTKRRAAGLKKSGEQFHIEIGVRELQLEGIGKRFLGFVRDISNEVTIEEAAKVSLSLLSLSPIPIIVIDSVGLIMQFSELASEVFGYKKEEVLGRNLKMLMPLDYSERHDEYLLRYAQTGKKTIIDSPGREVTALRKNGQQFKAEVSVREMIGTDGSKYFTGFVKPL